MKNEQKKLHQIQSVFMGGSLHSFLLYLLLNDLKKVENTFFFVHLKFLAQILDQHSWSYHFFGLYTPTGTRMQKFFTLLCRGIRILFWKLSAKVRWSFLRRVPIYGEDRAEYSVILIGRRAYTLLEEGMMNYSDFSKRKIRFRVLRRFLLGPLFDRRMGVGPQAKRIILTGLAKIPEHYRNKNVEIVSMERLWQESCEEKKNFILNVFDLTPDELVVLQGCDVLVLGQPLAHDGYMTEAEQIEMTRRILAPYEPSRVLLKPHPRDPLKYAELFPDVRVWNKPTPMELISLCGAKFKKVVTVNSTAALSFSYSLELDWLGKNLDALCFSHLCEASRKKFNRFAGEIPLPTERLVSA